MIYFLGFVFGAVALSMVIWGLSKPERIFQYPTLAGFIWLTYMLPEVIGVIRHPESIPREVVLDGGIELILEMYILCAFCGFVGYMIKPGIARYKKITQDVNINRIAIGGFVLLCVSYYGYHGLAMMSGGYVAFFSVTGNYTLDWEGMPVFYNFFMQMVYPALACCLYCALRKPSTLKWAITAAACVIPLGLTIFLGRRSQTTLFVVIVGSLIYLVRKWVPPAWLLLPMVVAMAVFAFAAPQYRTHSQIGGDWSKIREIDLKNVMTEVVEAKHEPEIFIGSIIMSAFNREATAYGLGVGYYNRLISQLVPKLIVGAKFKKSILLKYYDQDSLTMKYYGWRRPSSAAVPGPCDVFRDFWFAGCLVYMLLGAFYRFMWEKAKDSAVFQIIYASMAYYIVISIIGPVSLVPPKMIYLGYALGPILFWATRKDQFYETPVQESDNTNE